jgi:hypothetical protein
VKSNRVQVGGLQRSNAIETGVEVIDILEPDGQ